MMAGQILVPLRGSDRIELFFPYVEQIAQPGMKVVFLVHLGLSRFKELTDQLLTIHTGIRPALLPGQGSEEAVVEDTRRSAQERVLSACEVLRDRGVTVDVNVYAGRLRRVVREYLEKEDVQLVIMRPNIDRLTACLRKIGSLLRFFKPETVPPVLLLHPSNIVGR
jgi:nucleotide-binding universal stress UspA family protein